jgi:hypothetical protein
LGSGFSACYENSCVYHKVAMKIKVETQIEPLYEIPVIGKLIKRYRHKLPVIEGYPAAFYIEYKDLDSDIEDQKLLLHIRPVFMESHHVAGSIDRWGYEPWDQMNFLWMKFYPTVSGYMEMRVYFKDLTESDAIIDEYDRAQTFREDIGPDKNVRYYYKAYKIYSLAEVLMIVFTGIVTLFTILSFISVLIIGLTG